MTQEHGQKFNIDQEYPEHRTIRVSVICATIALLILAVIMATCEVEAIDRRAKMAEQICTNSGQELAKALSCIDAVRRVR